MPKGKGGGGGGGHDNNKNKNRHRGGGGGGGGGGENWRQQFMDLQGQFNQAQQDWQAQQGQQQQSDANAWWQPYVNPEPQQTATAGGPSAAEQGYGGYVPTVSPAQYNVTPPKGQPPVPQLPGVNPTPPWGGTIGGHIGGGGGGRGGGGGGGGGRGYRGQGPGGRRDTRAGRNPYAPNYGGGVGNVPTPTQPSVGIGDPLKRKRGLYY
jgi:hypothetical protein